MIKFCPECESVMIPKKSDKSHFILKCPHCNFSENKNVGPLIEKEKIPSKKIVGHKILKEGNEFATHDHECQKCGFRKAQIIDMGISYSDEDNLILLKCGKCGWSERVGRKVS
ncbi:MAG: hypothetical protein Q8P81_01165 [Nanoarchaeota archaeon]|nr:hypothetical protein [Nanoarchaeota archaeon]